MKCIWPKIITLLAFFCLCLGGAFAQEHLAFADTSQVTVSDGSWSWNADKTECTITGIVDASALRNELVANYTTVTTVSFTEGSGFTGNAVALFHICRNPLEDTPSVLRAINGAPHTPNVTNMGELFWRNETITSLDLSNFDTSHVKFFSAMFKQCYSLAHIDVSSFNTAAGTYFEGMFANCQALTALDIAGFDMTSAEDISSMFGGCYHLTSLIPPSYCKPTSLYSLFGDCREIFSIDVRWLDTSSCKDLSKLFYNCYKLKEVNVSQFNTHSVQTIEAMFMGCTSLTTLDISLFDTTSLGTTEASDVSNQRALWELCCGDSALQKIKLPDLRSGKITSFWRMFASCSSLTSIDLSQCNMKNAVPNSSSKTAPRSGSTDMFSGCKKLEQLILGPDCVFYKNEETHEYDCGLSEHAANYTAWRVYENDSVVSTTNVAQYQNNHAGSQHTYFGATLPTAEGWRWDETCWRYYLIDGINLHNGWNWLDNGWYYFDSSGAMASARWIWDEANASWYYCNHSGEMSKSCWLWIDGAWYGFWWNGKMCRGWIWDDDWQRWYFCYLNGSMARNAWIERYWVNNSGAWIK